MPRRVEDIIPTNHRSIRDIPFTRPVTKESPTTKPDGKVSINRIKEPLRHMPITPPPLQHQTHKWKFKWLILTLGILLIIAGAGYFASNHYSKATFTIVPKVIPIKVNGTKTYVIKAAQSSEPKGTLSYKIITATGSATTTVTATDGAEVNTKATGKVTIYNTFSTQSVRLIAGTRLAGDNGLIYRLTSSISIPGYTKPSSDIVAGKITTNIIADQAGQEYNISKTNLSSDLKIVAYKGSPRYESIYARLASDITGGFSGVKKTVNQSLLTSTATNLKTELDKSLLLKIKSLIPDGYIMYDTNYVTKFESPIIGDDKPGTATITEKGTIYGIVLPKNAFIDALAGNQSTSLFKPFDYTASGLETLDIVINNLKDFSPEKKTTLVIHAKGDVKLVGNIPVDEIKQRLAGISLLDTEEVFKSYSAVIESATGELLPPWAQVPNDTSRIHILVTED